MGKPQDGSRGDGNEQQARDTDERAAYSVPLVTSAFGSTLTRSTRAIDRHRYAHDASHYLLYPEAIVTPRDASQVGELLRLSRQQGVSLTFRSGGTSLSGQGVTDQLLVDTRRHFQEVDVLDEGRRVRVEPGVTLRRVNEQLAPFGRRLGPDPASEMACTIGGIVANNSSGMLCGTEQNSYRTLVSVVLVLASGTVLDTGARDADDRLRLVEPTLYEGLAKLRDRVRGNAGSVTTIREQFSRKNTMGYGINALLDYDSPAEILAHLVVGSEGTLAFVAQATFDTVPLLNHAATGLLVFRNLGEAMEAMPELTRTGSAAIELLDASSLRVAQRDPSSIASLRKLDVTTEAALLMEWQGVDKASVSEQLRDSQQTLEDLPLVQPLELGEDPTARSALWKIRKGLYAAVAGTRPQGTTPLLEDIAVPIPGLAETCRDLNQLFERHGYAGGVIFGHAKDGNLHFMLIERFEETAHPARYEAFTEDMVDLVLERGGTLKAEHGTGRVMAPFVRRQYGDELYDVMGRIKSLCDPHDLLNRGVLMTDDPALHLRHLKSTPVIEAEVDRCMECGYCEPNCPSRELTTTPRQRIVLRREIARAQARGEDHLVRQLEDDYRYEAIETCAVDGMCAVACPVAINTGDLIKRLRGEQNGAVIERGGRILARHWDRATTAIAASLDLAQKVPPGAPEKLSDAVRVVLGTERVPQWRRDLPGGGTQRRPKLVSDALAVFVPSCLGSMFAPEGDGDGVTAAMLALAERAGVALLVPSDVGGLCCGTPWSSKGLDQGHLLMSEKLKSSLPKWTSDRSIPVVTDASSCTEGFSKVLEAVDVRVIDAVEFAAEVLLPRLEVQQRLPSLVLHPTCSSTRLGIDDALVRVAEAIADEVALPEGWGCCAFAGDRGLLHPELTASATRLEASSVVTGRYAAHASLNRTCELALTRATGQRYRHILELFDEATRSSRAHVT